MYTVIVLGSSHSEHNKAPEWWSLQFWIF